MSEENDIDLFTEIESDIANKARKKALLKITTARVILGAFTLIVAFTSLWFFALLLVLFLISYKWPFLSLSIASTLFSMSTLLLLPEIYRKATNWEGVNVPTHLGELSGSILGIFLVYLLIRGAVAANEYGKTKKRIQ